MIKTVNCKCCSKNASKVMSFGEMPIANGFLEEDLFKNEYFFDMSIAFCESCSSIQLIDQPQADLMFHDEYAFFSRQSEYMKRHFKSYAEWVDKNYLNSKDSFVVEIGSNDGIMLQNFLDKGINHLGVDPSENVVEVAKSFGINAIVSFFGNESSKKIVSNYGLADAILAANVMCHLPDLNDIAKGAYNLLKDKGVLIFEDPYLGSMLEKVSYDQIYDEHVYIFSAISISKIFGRNGFELVDLLPQETHGGSMRYVLAKKGQREIQPIVSKILQKEMDLGFDKLETYEKFKVDCEQSKKIFVDKLYQRKEEGKSIAGYGATSKSTTILNYCNVSSELIDYISDTTPIKQNKYSPGMHIPVKSYEYFLENIPDVIVLFAWNHAKEIIEKEKEKGSIGEEVEWITHLPNFEINK